jgi:hypothetical protein
VVEVTGRISNDARTGENSKVDDELSLRRVKREILALVQACLRPQYCRNHEDSRSVVALDSHFEALQNFAPR